MSDPANRDSAGRFGPGNVANPSGRPKAHREFLEWIEGNALEHAKRALLKALLADDFKANQWAVKETLDRYFGKAPQAVTGEDGKPLLAGVGAEIVEAIKRMSDGPKST